MTLPIILFPLLADHVISHDLFWLIKHDIGVSRHVQFTVIPLVREKQDAHDHRRQYHGSSWLLEKLGHLAHLGLKIGGFPLAWADSQRCRSVVSKNRRPGRFPFSSKDAVNVSVQCTLACPERRIFAGEFRVVWVAGHTGHREHGEGYARLNTS